MAPSLQSITRSNTTVLLQYETGIAALQMGLGLLLVALLGIAAFALRQRGSEDRLLGKLIEDRLDVLQCFYGGIIFF